MGTLLSHYTILNRVSMNRSLIYFAVSHVKAILHNIYDLALLDIMKASLFQMVTNLLSIFDINVLSIHLVDFLGNLDDLTFLFVFVIHSFSQHFKLFLS